MEYGTPKQYKSKIIAKGYTQVHGFYYGETFSLVIKT
jgi:hypothetical protein